MAVDEKEEGDFKPSLARLNRIMTSKYGQKRSY